MKRQFLFTTFLSLFFSFVVFAQDESIVVTAPEANIRATPSTKSKIVGKVRRNQILAVSASQGNWYYVVHNEIKGWIHYSAVNKTSLSRTGLALTPSKPKQLRDWKPVAIVDSDGNLKKVDVHWIQPEKIVKIGPLLEFWVRHNIVTTEEKLDKSRTMTQYRVDCSLRRIGVFAIYKYDKKEELIGSVNNRDVVLESVVPGSVGERILESVCSLSKTP